MDTTWKEQTVERRGAAGRTLTAAQQVSDTATRVETDLMTGQTQAGAKVEKHGKKTVETHVGADGKTDKITTVERQKDGTVKVTTEVPGQSLMVQTEKVENGTTTVDENTIDLRSKGHFANTHRKSVTDGQTTTIDEKSTASDGTLQTSHDQWRTQTGTHGIRGEVAAGFSATDQTEVHDHSSITVVKGDLEKIRSDESSTYSQGSRRVTRDKADKSGSDSSTSWTQEAQNGDDYRAQTTVEGQPNVLIQVSRHADRATGTVTEDTANSDPIAHKVNSSTHTTRGYDDDARLTSSDTTAQDKDGTTTTTDYKARYSDHSDGTATVAEDTTTEVAKHGQPTRKTEQHVDATDTKTSTTTSAAATRRRRRPKSRSWLSAASCQRSACTYGSRTRTRTSYASTTSTHPSRKCHDPLSGPGLSHGDMLGGFPCRGQSRAQSLTARPCGWNQC